MVRGFQLIAGLLLPALVAACGDSDRQLSVRSDLAASNTSTDQNLPVAIPSDITNPDALLSDQGTATSHTAHTGPEAGVWPPQPQNLLDVAAMPSSVRDGVLSGVLGAARRSVLNNPQIQKRLGPDYREIEATFDDGKSARIANLVFYNYATDQAIDVAFGKDGAVSSQVFDAEWYQPAENAAEAVDAIVLARAALITSSFDVTGLEATAMLAFPPATAVESEQRHFYPHRMLYVTFGQGEGDLPVYTALVNLSSATVVEHGLVK